MHTGVGVPWWGERRVHSTDTWAKRTAAGGNVPKSGKAGEAERPTAIRPQHNHTIAQYKRVSARSGLGSRGHACSSATVFVH